VPVAHTCNLSYSGGRDQEDCGSKPAWANGPQDPISKNTKNKKTKPFTKKGWLSCRPSSNEVEPPTSDSSIGRITGMSHQRLQLFFWWHWVQAQGLALAMETPWHLSHSASLHLFMVLRFHQAPSPAPHVSNFPCVKEHASFPELLSGLTAKVWQMGVRLSAVGRPWHSLHSSSGSIPTFPVWLPHLTRSLLAPFHLL
jgi:hypothetical protein